MTQKYCLRFIGVARITNCDGDLINKARTLKSKPIADGKRLNPVI